MGKDAYLLSLVRAETELTGESYHFNCNPCAILWSLSTENSLQVRFS